MSDVDLFSKIPNNVGLKDDKKLKRALERWLPDYQNWWPRLHGRPAPGRLQLRSLPLTSRAGFRGSPQVDEPYRHHKEQEQEHATAAGDDHVRLLGWKRTSRVS